jgi:hypothetical protein
MPIADFADSDHFKLQRLGRFGEGVWRTSDQPFSFSSNKTRLRFAPELRYKQDEW